MFQKLFKEVYTFFGPGTTTENWLKQLFHYIRLNLKMEQSIRHLESIVKSNTSLLEGKHENYWEEKERPEKWSRKEILGHLVDSALNNQRRFIVGQYEESPFIVYNQNKWVELSNYQQYDTKSLITLWTAINNHIIHILKNMSPAGAERFVNTDIPHTIEELVKDYIQHLLHHLQQLEG